VFHLPPCCLILALSCLLHSSQYHCVFRIFVCFFDGCREARQPQMHLQVPDRWVGQTAKTSKQILSGHQEWDSRSEETWRKGRTNREGKRNCRRTECMTLGYDCAWWLYSYIFYIRYELCFWLPSHLSSSPAQRGWHCLKLWLLDTTYVAFNFLFRSSAAQWCCTALCVTVRRTTELLQDWSYFGPAKASTSVSSYWLAAVALLTKQLPAFCVTWVLITLFTLGHPLSLFSARRIPSLTSHFIFSRFLLSLSSSL